MYCTTYWLFSTTATKHHQSSHFTTISTERNQKIGSLSSPHQQTLAYGKALYTHLCSPPKHFVQEHCVLQSGSESVDSIVIIALLMSLSITLRLLENVRFRCLAINADSGSVNTYRGA
ncbi:hypothetical protein NPIL_40141 [Nephila pilipes]|uniref:Uncharacterized protein n=1 Tax=Nephila pilipes TaxID=299642 RepID=A0A8X6Q386_NEPPI|nr:hypothetical protein NPIL_40141 [Nephila pilipes]